LNRERHLEGIKLLNTGKFFEAHEVLEDVWRDAPFEEKKYWQGLVQVAVALHHHSTGNMVGARSVMARAARNLGPCSREWHGIDIGELRRVLTEWLEAVQKGKATSSPVITFVDC
jgi:uncharacterized protein